MKKIVLLMLVTLIIAGCTNEQEVRNDEDIPELIEVTLEIDSPTIKTNEEIMIKAKITQGKEMVKDANEVTFEIWRDGQTEKEHEKFEGKIDQKEGVYFINKTFNEPGLYYVITHVTARNMHTMPKLELEVVE
ncbi:FixH family protein [Peribacillus simplex]|uniref:FixH family protein n=1 Tax=Peribacillus simplex TaxID=1478 RepID=UPI0011A68051|nr:FixH family protein [Peribacillus simplex]